MGKRKNKKQIEEFIFHHISQDIENLLICWIIQDIISHQYLQAKRWLEELIKYQK